MTHSSATCPDCERLSGDYESATIRWFRLDSQMRIAEFGLDRDSTLRIASEMASLDLSRTALRQALHEHTSLAHSEATRAFAA
jgi:hypothetical protein